MTVRKTSRA